MECCKYIRWMMKKKGIEIITEGQRRRCTEAKIPERLTKYWKDQTGLQKRSNEEQKTDMARQGITWLAH